MTDYQFVSELVSHTAYVKSICVLSSNEEGTIFATGSFDNVLKIWKSNAQGNAFELVKDQMSHAKPINSIAKIPNGSGFVTGSSDGTIRVFTMEGEYKTALAGHEKDIISLSFNSSGQLLSGSFDGSAKIWTIAADLKSGTCVKTLGSHENAVSVLGLPNDVVATASTGFKSGMRIEGAKVRLFNKTGTVIATIAKHTSSIRGLCLHPDGTYFYSCGNDGMIVQYDLKGEVLKTFQCPTGYEGVPAFVYAIDVNPQGDILASCDDFCARIFHEDGTMETIAHPKNVWVAKFLPNGDVVSGAGDPVVRVFSKDENRKASAELIATYLKACDESIAATRNAEMGQQELDPKKYPKIEDMANFVGRQNGETKLFNVSGTVWLYQWDYQSAQWVAVGECVGAKVDKTVDGVEFDTVIEIEVENQGSAGLRKLRLGINDGDNPYVVATEFCQKNSIPLDQLELIVEHIRMKQGPSANPDYSQPMDVDTPPPAKKKTKFPLSTSTGCIYEAGKLSAICSKIKEFNEKVPADAKLPMDDLRALDELEAVLSDTSRYHASAIPESSARMFKRIFDHWDTKHMFPVFDLVRLALIHPQTLPTLGETTVKNILRTTMNSVGAAFTEFKDDETLQLQVSLTALKLFCNVFNTSAGVSFLLGIARSPDSSTLEGLLKPLEDVTDCNNKNVRAALATVLLNYSNAMCHAHAVSETLNFIFLKIINDSLLPAVDVKEELPIIRSLTAVGCIFLERSNQGGDLSEEESKIKDALLAKVNRLKSSDLDQTLLTELSDLLSGF